MSRGRRYTQTELDVALAAWRVKFENERTERVRLEDIVTSQHRMIDDLYEHLARVGREAGVVLPAHPSTQVGTGRGVTPPAHLRLVPAPTEQGGS